MSGRVKVGDVARLVEPLEDGYVGAVRIIAAGDQILRVVRLDNHHEAICHRNDVKLTSQRRPRPPRNADTRASGLRTT